MQGSRQWINNQPQNIFWKSMKENIEKQLRTWFAQMTKKYSWLRIKFEFNENRGVFMVSFSPVSQIELSNDFNMDAMKFADEMNEQYGNDAPLFTDEESLFKLSSNAVIIEAPIFVTTNSPLLSKTIISVQPQRCSWTPAYEYTPAQTGKNFHQTKNDVSFAIAA